VSLDAVRGDAVGGEDAAVENLVTAKGGLPVMLHRGIESRLEAGHLADDVKGEAGIDREGAPVEREVFTFDRERNARSPRLR